MLHNFTELQPSLLQNLSCGRWQSPWFITDSRVGEKRDRTRLIINDDLGYCWKKNVFRENLTKIRPGRTGNSSVGEFSTGIVGCKNVFWSIELVLFSIANQTI